MADETSTSSGITFTGLGSGMDFEAIIEATVKVEQVRVQRLEAWKSDWQTKVDAFQELNTRLLSLKTSMEGMDSINEFMVKSASSTDSTVLTASADADALSSSHTIIVNRLATNDVWVGDHGYSSTDASVNTSGSDQVFAYSYGGTNVSVTVGAGTTLAGLVNALNNDPDNPGVRASALKVDEGDYRLQIWGMDLGDSYEFTVGGATTLSNAGAASFTETQDAKDCQFKLDGFPSAAGAWIERSSNTLTDVIEGLTLNLKGAGTASVSASVDTEAVKEQVRTFVDQINEVRTLILELTEFDDVTKKASVLTGNYGIQLISSRLKSITAGKCIGFDYDADTYSVLSQLGISTDAEEGSVTQGLLVLDEDVLDAALEDNPDAAAEIFAADFIGATSSSDFRYYSHIQSMTKAGTYAVAYTVDAGGNITSATINGHTALIDNDTGEITGASGQDEVGLVVKVQNFTAGDYTGTVRLKQGKAGELVDALKTLTSSTSGPLHILEENYQDIMDNIDEKIEFEERRIDRMERDLRNKYARLEALLGYYDGMSSSLSNQISQLDSK
jgi:flagellar hook-associated protein 2